MGGQEDTSVKAGGSAVQSRKVGWAATEISSVDAPMDPSQLLDAAAAAGTAGAGGSSADLLLENAARQQLPSLSIRALHVLQQARSLAMVTGFGEAQPQQDKAVPPCIHVDTDLFPAATYLLPLDRSILLRPPPSSSLPDAAEPSHSASAAMRQFPRSQRIRTDSPDPATLVLPSASASASAGSVGNGSGEFTLLWRGAHGLVCRRWATDVRARIREVAEMRGTGGSGAVYVSVLLQVGEGLRAGLKAGLGAGVGGGVGGGVGAGGGIGGNGTAEAGEGQGIEGKAQEGVERSGAEDLCAPPSFPILGDMPPVASAAAAAAAETAETGTGGAGAAGNGVRNESRVAVAAGGVAVKLSLMYPTHASLLGQDSPAVPSSRDQGPRLFYTARQPKGEEREEIWGNISVPLASSHSSSSPSSSSSAAAASAGQGHTFGVAQLSVQWDSNCNVVQHSVVMCRVRQKHRVMKAGATSPAGSVGNASVAPGGGGEGGGGGGTEVGADGVGRGAEASASREGWGNEWAGRWGGREGGDVQGAVSHHGSWVVPATSSVQVSSSHWVHTAQLPASIPTGHYNYRVLSGSQCSPVFSFHFLGPTPYGALAAHRSAALSNHTGGHRVSCGHSHAYQRGERNGVMYAILGGGGERIDKHRVADWGMYKVTHLGHHYVRVDLSAHLLSWSAYDAANNPIDHVLFVPDVDDADEEEGSQTLR
ncbi:unnamed protein product [Closterium sp. Yama58-4]|nr:unnamed protein product [Closterium sp. Yama58-4]